MSEIGNLRYVRANGIREFLAKETYAWITAPGVFCVHDKKRYKPA